METTQDAASSSTTTTEPASAPANPLLRSLDLTVSLADVEQEVERELKRIAKTAKMPGFRPGKAPLKLIAQHYGSQARVDAIGAALEKAFAALVRQQNLRVAGAPKVEAKPSTAEDRLAFTATFEVYPEITLADLAGRTLEKPVLTITDAEIDRTLEILRKQRQRYVAVERAAQRGDRVIIDFVGRKNGEDFPGNKAENYAVVLGAGRMLADFEAALEGMQAGEEKTFDVAFPADYHAPELAGQTVTFTVKVTKVEEPRLPEVDANFARELGIADGDLARMRAEVKNSLEREVNKRLSARLKAQVMDLLLEAHPIVAPTALVEAEAREMAEGARAELKNRHSQLAQLPVEPSWFRDQAERRVKLGLIIAECVRANNLAATPAQVRAVVDEYAAAFEDAQEVVRWYYADPRRLAQAEALALENNVVDWVMKQVTVVEKPIAFEELMGSEA
ncbi:MAG: trigger factor [Rhodocyclaceae bacterium]|nr:trigger factor [Rhodocyclaceae bacterium]